MDFDWRRIPSLDQQLAACQVAEKIAKAVQVDKWLEEASNRNKVRLYNGYHEWGLHKRQCTNCGITELQFHAGNRKIWCPSKP